MVYPPKKSGIYAIRNILNGKVYVGSAVNIEARWRVHLHALRRSKHHSAHLQRAWDKHGSDAFAFEILENCEPAALIEREQYYIDTLHAAERHHGYNVASVAGSQLGFRHSEDSRRKVSESHRGRKQSPEMIANRVAGMRAARDARGGPTEAEIAAIEIRAAKRRGKPQLPHIVELHRARLTGVKQSPELVERRVAPLRGRKIPPDHLAKLIASKLGKPRPDINEWASVKFKKFDMPQIFAIDESYLAGESCRAIAKRLGCSDTTISYVLNRKGHFYSNVPHRSDEERLKIQDRLRKNCRNPQMKAQKWGAVA